MKWMQIGLLVLGFGWASSAAWAGSLSRDRGAYYVPLSYVRERPVHASYRSCAPRYVQPPACYVRPVCAPPRMVPADGWGYPSRGYRGYGRAAYPARPLYRVQPGLVVIAGW